MDRWLWGQASLPFLRGGVSRSSLSDTRPLTANEKDPSAPLEMTIREEHFSSAHFIRYSRYPSPTLSFRAKREIFLALRAFLLPSQKHSHFPYHTYDIIPFCKKDPSTSLGMTIQEEHFSSAHFIRYSRYPSPTLSFRAKREIFLALRAFLLPSQKHSHFPYHTYDIIPFCKKDPSTSLGMTMRMALCSRYFHAATPKSASSRHIDPSLWSAPSLRRAKKGS